MLDTSNVGHGVVGPDVAPAAAPRADGWFDFVSGEENQLAASALAALVDDAVRAVESPWPNDDDRHAQRAATSPLVLYGPTGTGKSHLCAALVRQWRARLPADAVEHLPAVEFAEQYAAGVAADEIAEFRRRFREVDLLVLEDVGRLSTKPQAQAELLHALDALERRGAAVVVTLATAPAQCDALLPGLVSRLTAGLVAGLVQPRVAGRRRILERLAQVRRLTIDARAIDLLAADMETTVPQLAGALATLELMAADAATDENSDKRRPPRATRGIDAALVRRYLDRRTATSAPTMKTIAEQSARHHGLKIADLKSSSRRRTVVAARDVAVFLARRLNGSSFQEIGNYFGGRDHTTIMHSYRKLDEALASDAELRDTLEQIRAKLRRI